MNLTVSELMLAFLKDRSFAGRLINALPHVSVRDSGTMAIGIHNGRIALFTDPEFVRRVSLPFGHFCMEHEILGHYANAHIPRFLEFVSRYPKLEDKKKARVVFNVAADCAVNSLLRRNKTFAIADKEMLDYAKWRYPNAVFDDRIEGALVLPERHGLPPDESLEFYLAELMRRSGLGRRATIEQVQFYQGMLKWLTSTDPFHVNWLDDTALDTMSPEELHSLAHRLHNVTKHILRRVVDETRKGRGTVPGQLVEWLDEYLADPIVPWWEIFTTRIRATKQAKAERGIQQPNRTLLAMGEEDPSILTSIGVVRDVSWRAFMVRDVSGSMDTESCRIGLSELQHILNLDEDMEIRDLQFDAAVQSDRVFRHGDKLPTNLNGRGGTDFNVAFEHMQQYLGNAETEPDIVIVFTDGGAPVIPPALHLPPEIPVIWCISPHGDGQHLDAANYGEVIMCDSNQNEMWKYRNTSFAGGEAQP
jgi:predicted metal-dependent peptidase